MEVNDKIKIPLAFQDLIANASSSTRGMVLKFCSESEQFLGESPYFFPDYTDHSSTHIEYVLSRALELIPQDVIDSKQFTPEDSCCLVLSTFLHDMGMHIGKKGFKEIVNDEWESKLSLYLFETDEKWSSLWKNYLIEIKSWRESKLQNVLGHGRREYVINLNELELDSSIHEDQIRLIGEFIRRHHDRIAYEISYKGFPANNDFPNLYKTDSYIAEISGLIARSHGNEIRDYVEKAKRISSNECRHREVCASYVMALLRISDHLQLSSQRAPRHLLKLKSPQSPLSLKEWQKNEAVAEARKCSNTEVYFRFTFDPNNVSALLHRELNEEIEGIQRNLDLTNAVLSEEFIKKGEVENQLRLQYTRVVTNLHDEDFRNRVSYIPSNAKRQVNENLLPLLTEPLYGKEAQSMALRELIQNSVDAVRERKAIQADDLDNEDWEISLSLIQNAEGTWNLEIEDKGVGMSPEVIENYYLIAGLSSREESSISSSSTKKTGRFGIGVFSGFAIADDFFVETKPISGDTAIAFKVTRAIADVYLEKGSKKSFGTKVTFILPNKAVSLNEDGEPSPNTMLNREFWYYGSDIKLQRLIKWDSGERLVESKFQLPTATEKDGWFELPSDRFPYFRWAFTSRDEFFCNDFIIKGDVNSSPISRSLANDTMRLARPTIAIDDPEAKLSLNLQRSEVLNFHEDMYLLYDLSIDLIAYQWAYINYLGKEASLEVLNKYHHPQMHSAGRSRPDSIFTNFKGRVSPLLFGAWIEGESFFAPAFYGVNKDELEIEVYGTYGNYNERKSKDFLLKNPDNRNDRAKIQVDLSGSYVNGEGHYFTPLENLLIGDSLTVLGAVAEGFLILSVARSDWNDFEDELTSGRGLRFKKYEVDEYQWILCITTHQIEISEYHDDLVGNIKKQVKGRNYKNERLYGELKFKFQKEKECLFSNIWKSLFNDKMIPKDDSDRNEILQTAIEKVPGFKEKFLEWELRFREGSKWANVNYDDFDRRHEWSATKIDEC